VPFVGPLDPYTTNLSGAWSVARRLLSSYTGPLIRVRRSSDNTELDIGYLANGSLDEASLLTFCGAGNGFIATVYGQTGTSNLSNGNVAAEESMIVDTGAVLVSAGFPGMLYDGTDDWIQATVAVAMVEFFISHATGASANNGQYLIDGRPDLADSFVFDNIIIGGNWINCWKDGVATTLDGAGVFDAVHHLTTLQGSGNTPSAFFLMRFNGFVTACRAGYIREIATYSAALSNADRDGVEAALMP